MSEASISDAASAMAAFEEAADALDRVLADDVEAEVEEIVQDLTSLASEWEGVLAELAEKAEPAISEARGASGEIRDEGQNLRTEIDALVEHLSAIAAATEPLHGRLEAARSTVPDGLDAVASGARDVSDAAGARLAAPIAALAGEATTRVGAHRERVQEGVRATLLALSEDCSGPATEATAEFGAGLSSVVATLEAAFDRNRQYMDTRANQVLAGTHAKATDVLHALGGETVEVVAKLAETVRDVAELIRAIGELKEVLVDGISLTNSGVQVVIDLLEELEELLGDH